MFRFKEMLKSLNLFCILKGIDDGVKQVKTNVSNFENNVNKKFDEINHYKEKYKDLIEERKRERDLFVSVMDHLDDMVWAKDLNGCYLMANKSFREKFCYSLSWDEIKGKNDIELSKIFKDKVGDENHTFGEICGNSDEVIHATEEAKQFLEHGKIDGKIMKLVVNKSPMYDYSGIFYATVGSGRDVTKWHDELEKAAKSCGTCDKNYKFIMEALEMYRFREGDQCQTDLVKKT